MLLSDYIDRVYGSSRGNRARFLKDNPDILPQELSRWLKAGLKIRPETAEIYKPVSLRVRVPDVAAAEAGVFLSDSLRGRLTTLAVAQNVTPDAMLSALVEREELRRQLAPVPAGEDTVPEQLIAGVVSRHLNIPRTAYYWYGGFVAKRVAMMLGCYHVYLWNDMMHPESDVVFIGDARNVVACWFICQQMCRLLKAVRLNWRKQQGAWGSRAELDEESHQYAKRLAYSVLDNGIFIGGDEQNFYRLHRYAEKKYAWAMR
ncbi:hypothetical protein MH280_004665 [Salmonella enterica]|nr:hypothetical protein [Salmonella enterica]